MSACNEIIDDIEDLISSQDITPKERYANKKNVTVRSKRKANDAPEPKCTTDKQIHESIIPGTQKIYLKTWGKNVDVHVVVNEFNNRIINFNRMCSQQF